MLISSEKKKKLLYIPRTNIIILDFWDSTVGGGGWGVAEVGIHVRLLSVDQ